MLVEDTKVLAKSRELADLQRDTLQQLGIMSGLRREEALRGLLVGAALLRIKASIGHGNFMPWVKANVTTIGQRWVNYLMRLALVFFAKSRVLKSELLALPGDQLNLAIEGKEGMQRQMVEKAVKFVGDLSIAELLEKHGIKDTKKLGGARDKKEGDEAPATIDPEQLAANARAALSDVHETLRQLLLTDNVCQYLSKTEIRDFDKSLGALLGRWRSSLRATLAKDAC